MKYGEHFTNLIFRDNGETPNDSQDHEVETLHISLTPNKEITKKLSNHIKESNDRWTNLFNIVTKLRKTIVHYIKSIIETKLSKFSRDIEKLDKKMSRLIDHVSTLEEENVSRDLYQRLNEELTKHQEDSDFRKTKGAIIKCIDLYDDLEKSLKEDSKIQQKTVLEILRELRVEKISERAEKFDPNFQKAIHREKTHISAKDSKVIDVIHEGFKYLGDRVVRPQLVAIYKFPTQEEGDRDER